MEHVAAGWFGTDECTERGVDQKSGSAFVSHYGPSCGSPYVKPMPAKRIRPPEVALSEDVYERLCEASEEERRARWGAARPYGVRVMDAIEAHADRLQRVWSADTPPPGGLFVRPGPEAVPPRRRHATPPVCIALSGIDAANAQLLDRYAVEWSAGTRAALVEQALRFDLGMA